ncbi:MAG TPA: hypothetical protein VFT87_03745, partial [Candidatus Saccharimonadales bacterium]|nr:hypothetical protein [Candidatus Saccharimonadales bacterium]
MIAGSVAKSIEGYINALTNNQYLVKSKPNIPIWALGYSDQQLTQQDIDELKQIEAEYRASQEAKIKKAGLDSTKVSFEPIVVPNPFADNSLPESRRVMINRSSPVVISTEEAVDLFGTKLA